MAAASLPIAIHLKFAVWEVWSLAFLVGIGVYLLGAERQVIRHDEPHPGA
ncbi:hypothetical protein JQ559_16665 [Bradyrhizobium viridifuturi]|jgi:hypothetical protein|nr:MULTISPECIES: hypothetical protein [Bradyrhizobium]QRI68618.1 hypothetical protein JQ507_27465 [Bradyrhizobium sp. PSBB068]MBR1021621.1 hypothetical protein [Bradyrhizobium viridifuturi]MBR1038399.1 hypothetical protein [Bradyrhizobium viridifuturi]MBR1045287.1 hypothetical protein [Bradyrhizobium viridifuturi]MBR1073417.1 hypothetical protein [Bradyrhizobium viridifuturi]